MSDDINYPAIVVVGYNRPEALKRLFDSLLAAEYPLETEITLIISLDFCSDDTVENTIKNLVNGLHWPHGATRIINHSQSLGLKKHILSCGDLTEQYQSVILLEDDLFVSPHYYSFSCQSLNYYQDREEIAGISLYSHQNNPYLRLPFYPIEDGSDVYFLQFASSWGQVWSKKQWQSFKNWYSKDIKVSMNDPLPDGVISWPDSSWLKVFIKFMVEMDKLFVYPRVSLSTNFGDSGTHFAEPDSYFQVPILQTSKDWNFVSLENSLAIYDSFFELSFGTMNKLTDHFSEKGYTIDLYGKKKPEKVTEEYMLTTKKCVTSSLVFGNRMKPEALNIVNNIPGDDIRFCKTVDVVDSNSKQYDKKQNFKSKIASQANRARSITAKYLEIAADILKPNR